MTAAAAVRIIAATLPAGVRDRYREEWLADVTGAAELSTSRWAIVVGALGVAVSIDREESSTSGMTFRRLVFRRTRVALAAAASGMLLLLAVFWSWAWTGVDSRGGLEWSSLSWGGRLLLVAALLCMLVVIISVVGIVRAAARSRARRASPWLIGVVAAATVLGLGPLALMPVLGVPILVAGLVALVVVLAREDPRSQAAPPRRRTVVVLALFSASAILATVAGSLLHIYVWNPLARMPGMTLDEIYAGLETAGELPGPALPATWVGFWVLFALVLVVAAILPDPRIRRLATARRIAGIGILGVALAAAGAWFVGFGMGMGMADAFMTSGGDAAVSGPVLSLIGIGYAIAAVLVGLLPSRVRPATS